jgi:tetratricopeptide (TPR) repeat protein
MYRVAHDIHPFDRVLLRMGGRDSMLISWLKSLFRRPAAKHATLPNVLPGNDADADLERFFTDAEEARGRFDELIGPAPLDKKILVVHGVGAVGKSSLLKMFRLGCRRKGVAVGLVAAEDAASIVDLLESWSDDMRASGVTLSALTQSIDRYHRLHSKVEDERLKAGQPVADGADQLAHAAAVGLGLVANAAPVVGPAIKDVAVEAAEAFATLLRSWLSRTDFEFYRDPTERLTDDLVADLGDAARHRRLVLMLDTVEQLTALSGWLRETAHRLPDNVLLVIAGRAMPHWDAEWPGWQARAEVLELTEMRDEDVRRLVHQYSTAIDRTLGEEQIDQVVRFARGLPMAATTAARLWTEHQAEDRPVDDPRVVAELAELLLRGVPDETRPAFEAAAVLRTFNADSLGALLGGASAGALYDELRRWPFTRSRRGGLAVHDTMRDVMNGALQARSPQHFHELNQKASEFYHSLLARQAAEERERARLEWLYHTTRADEASGIESFRVLAEEMVVQRRLAQFRALLNEVNTYPLEVPDSQLWLRYYNARLAHLESRTAAAEDQYREVAGRDDAAALVRAYALCDLGEILAQFDRLSEPDGERRALEVVERSIALHPQGDRKLISNRNTLSAISNVRADWRESVTQLDFVYNYSASQGDAFGAVLADQRRAAVYGLQGNWNGYLDTRKRYVATAAQLGDLPVLQMQISYFTWPLVFMGRYREAAVSSEAALRCAERIDERELRITILESIGLALGLQGLDQQAEERFAQGMNFYENFHLVERSVQAGTPDRFLRGLLTFRGLVSLRQGRRNDAESDLHRALQIKREIHDQIGTPEVHVWLGELHELQGEWDRAEHEYSAALELRSVQRHYFECLATVGLARRHMSAGNPANAAEHLAAAEVLATRFEYSDVLASVRLVQGHAAWDGQVTSWPQGVSGAQRGYREALVHALRYNRFLLDEALTGRSTGSVLAPIIPACQQRGAEGRKMLESLLDWWRTGTNALAGDPPHTTSPIERGTSLVDAERVARERERGDDSIQTSVADRLETALATP